MKPSNKKYLWSVFASILLTCGCAAKETDEVIELDELSSAPPQTLTVSTASSAGMEEAVNTVSLVPADEASSDTPDEPLPPPGEDDPDLSPDFDENAMLPREITLAFAGDINFDDNHTTMNRYYENGCILSSVMDQDFLNAMNEADLFWINNEFAYSDRGAPLPNKMYVFRSHPENASLLLEMGADIVGLANNHVYDYGEEAMIDTLNTLTDIGIPYVGAGFNLTEAASPVYFDLDGFTIAYVAASRAEKYRMTPQATETTPGILRCYDNSIFLASIAEAAANADYVIALPHWGTEYSTVLEEAQTEGAAAYIAAGADAVIGAHSHCLQGLAFIADKPIAYSLGNFWFNDKTLDTMLYELHITLVPSADTDHPWEISEVTPQILPGVQSACVTTMSDTPEEQRRIFDTLEGISENIRIEDDGSVHPAVP